MKAVTSSRWDLTKTNTYVFFEVKLGHGNLFIVRLDNAKINSTKVLPVIHEKFPQSKKWSPVYIQQYNIKPHFTVNDPNIAK